MITGGDCMAPQLALAEGWERAMDAELRQLCLFARRLAREVEA